MTNFIEGLVRERRAALTPDHRKDVQQERWGLALSGGGIRSATFCLGLLHALAKNKVFHRFDLLSTVSGGGYIGSTVGKLFHSLPTGPAEATAAQEPAAPITSPPPGAAPAVAARSTAERVEEALADADRRWFTWWLRANGRYLIPHGTKDAFFAGATFGRNLLAVHFELALLAFLLGLGLSAVDIVAWQWFDLWSSTLTQEWQKRLLVALTGWPTAWLLLPVFAVPGVLAACAYWVYPSDVERSIARWRWAAMVFAMVGLYALAKGWKWLGGELLVPLVVRATVAVVLGTMIAAAGIAGLLMASKAGQPRVRNWLTRWLAWFMKVSVLAFLAGCVDYLAWHLSLADGGLQGRVAVGIALAGAVLRALLPKLAEVPGSFSPAVRRAFGAILNLAGLMVLAGLAIFWVSLVHSVVTQRLFALSIPAFELAWYTFLSIFVPALVMFITSASNFAFLNKSSLYSFYKARLVRGYLGAANGKRFGKDTQALDPVPEVRDDAHVVHVSRVHEGDDMDMFAYQPHAWGGPVHLINVCANQTRDPRGGLFNQDRKGLSLTVGPGRTRLALEDWAPLVSTRAMTLGSWMAISGAAVSPGMGGATRPGIAALAMMAGLRLGYWWEGQESQGMWRRIGKYGLLFSELLGRFNMERKAPWFLSDGGHFENTGAYALLREKCDLVVLADCGADPRYAFGDIENLVRKARIDLQADIRFLKPKAPLAPGWESFGSLSDIASTESSASLALAAVEYAGGAQGGYLIVVKPTMYAGLPVDLVNFKADNPAFPQEPTTDQFFDEAQWESYFRLGSVLGKCLGPELLKNVQYVARNNFEPDDGALTQVPGAHPVGPAAAAAASAASAAASASASAKRLPARIVATGAVTASVSLGAIASLGVTAYQTINSEAKQRREAQKTDPAEVKELSRLYADLIAARSDERGRAAVNLAVALSRVAEQVCDGPSVKGYQSSPNVKTILVEARKSCIELGVYKVEACKQFIEQLPTSAACLEPPVWPRCVPHYWIRDYAHNPDNCRPEKVAPSGPNQDASSTVPSAGASAPAPATSAGELAPDPRGGRGGGGAGRADPQVTAGIPAVPGSAPATPDRSCAGKTVYIQIHGPEQRELARALRTEWRSLGASVPPIEDVVQSARQEQRPPPTAVTVPTIVEHNDASNGCSLRLARVSKEVSGFDPAAWKIRPLPSVLQSQATRDVIEVWLPPKGTAAAAK